MTAPLILVVEDEPTIAQAIGRRLAAEGYQIETVGDGLKAVEVAAKIQPDALILDVMLPGIDGLEVCRRVQAVRPLPVLMLTARDDETDKLVGLGVGADDYMTKPFSMRELVARLKALLRRVDRAKQLGAEPAPPSEINLGGITINRARRRVSQHGREVHMTPTEFELLSFLADHPDTVLSREQLLEHVWDWVDASATRTVDSHIKGLRRKLGAEMFRTVHGVGYAFEPDAGR
ncbi:MAG: response regulator transcription factor [Micrococcales bacterium]|nr:response regulator transcription factor [Micrococcales bacterium]